jgi:hypothetical protein
MQETTRKNEINAAEVYEKMQARVEAEQALQNHVWNLPEVEHLQARAQNADDVQAVQEFAALKSYIDAGHDRGDFSYPWELSRKDAQAYIEGKGKKGQVWSIREVSTVGREYFNEYGAEAREALNKGLVIDAPGTLRGRITHFKGEDDATFERELQKRFILIDQKRAAEKTLAETASMLPTIRNAGVPKHYLEVQLAKIWQDDTDQWPVDELPGYLELQDAYLLAGGSLGDINAIRASMGKMRHPFLTRK